MQTSLSNVPPFQSPGWCFNGHVHTIARSALSHPQKPPHKRIEISTSDDDFLELDVIEGQQGHPALVLFHGLESSTDRYYMIELMRVFSSLNYSVVAVNFRSCGSKMNRRRRFYHSGETKDLMSVFLWMKDAFPDSQLAAVGFSLGGNVLLKSLGEEEDHPLRAAVAVSVPYHLKAGAQNIDKGFNKVYQHQFVRSLRKKLEKKRERYPDLPRFDGSTLYEFDNQVTAPVHGFKDADEYYHRCSSERFVPDIGRPALLIHSREDPICPVDCMPMGAIKQNDFLDFVITERGGHVGFWYSEKEWLNRVIANYILQKID